MAEHYTNLKEYENAIKCYMEALFYDEENIEVHLSSVLFHDWRIILQPLLNPLIQVSFLMIAVFSIECRIQNIVMVLLKLPFFRVSICLHGFLKCHIRRSSYIVFL